MTQQRGTLFSEISGKLDTVFRPPATLEDKVVLSNISHGGHVGTRAPGIGIKYVARGTEYYTIGGRTHAVRAGHFLCVPQSLPSEVEVRRTGEPTLGLCIFLRAEGEATEAAEPLEAPLIFPAGCSALGTLLEKNTADLMRPAADRAGIAAALVQVARGNLEILLEDAGRELASLGKLKKSTRYETLRRLATARGYLHQVTDRPVELAELAAVAGLSRFHLLRHFRDCYGAPPGAYHRQLRLRLAKHAIDEQRLTCGDAAQRYGFADGSSLSHAHRRAFGQAPVRSLSPDCAG